MGKIFLFLWLLFDDLFLFFLNGFLASEDEEVSDQEAVDHRDKKGDGKDSKSAWGGFATMSENVVDAKGGKAVMERVGWDNDLGKEDSKMDKG